MRNVLRGGGVIRPKILGDWVGGDWSEVGWKETAKDFVECVEMSKSTPSVHKLNVNEVGGVNVQMARIVMPDTSDERIRFVGLMRNGEEGIMGMNQRIYDEIEGDDSKIGVLYQPLKIMFTPDLEMRGLLVGEGDNGMIIGNIPN